MSLRRTVCFLSIGEWALISAAIPTSAQVTTIRYAFWGNPAAIGVEQEIIDAFHEAHPDIRVVPIAVAYNDYHPRLLTQIAGGSRPM